MDQGEATGRVCGKCGAKRIDSQIGLEVTPDEYLATMVQVFREVRRVMRPDATCWINLGDSFVDKQLLMMPARLALALQADGWWIRSDIIWSKPNPMPESVTDRPTSAHEHVFLLTKAARYFFDADAVREKVGEETRRATEFRGESSAYKDHQSENNSADVVTYAPRGEPSLAGRNLRNVWTIATYSFPDAHFATYPPELAERCIKAGTSERGCCAQCGKPWVRETETSYYNDTTTDGRPAVGNNVKGGETQGQKTFASGVRTRRYDTTTGWAPGCQCGTTETRPAVVLDCFAGAGTTGLVADRLQRDAIMIELSPDYVSLMRTRIEREAGLFSSVVEGPVCNGHSPLIPPLNDTSDITLLDLIERATSNSAKVQCDAR